MNKIYYAIQVPESLNLKTNHQFKYSLISPNLGAEKKLLETISDTFKANEGNITSLIQTIESFPDDDIAVLNTINSLLDGVVLEARDNIYPESIQHGTPVCEPLEFDTSDQIYLFTYNRHSNIVGLYLVKPCEVPDYLTDIPYLVKLAMKDLHTISHYLCERNILSFTPYVYPWLINTHQEAWLAKNTDTVDGLVVITKPTPILDENENLTDVFTYSVYVLFSEDGEFERQFNPSSSKFNKVYNMTTTIQGMLNRVKLFTLADVIDMANILTTFGYDPTSINFRAHIQDKVIDETKDEEGNSLHWEYNLYLRSVNHVTLSNTFDKNTLSLNIKL